MTPALHHAIRDAIAFLSDLPHPHAEPLALRLELCLSGLDEPDPGPDPFALELGTDPEEKEATHAL